MLRTVSGKKEAPGEQPDEMERPVEGSGELVVVLGIALADEAEEVFVDEVEPEEAVVAKAGEDVPRRGDGKEEQGAAEQAELAPAAKFTGDQQVEEGGAGEEDDPDQPLGENGERHESVDRVPVARSVFSLAECGGEAIERGGEEEADDDLGDESAGEEELADRGQHHQRGVEAGARDRRRGCPSAGPAMP